MDISGDQWVVELLGGYKPSARIALLAGVRYNNIRSGLKFKGPAGARIGSSETWWDPFFGVQGNLPLGKKLNASARFDLGGFGAGSTIAVNAEPLLHYQINKRLTASLGWKFLYQDYKNSAQGFAYDVLLQGPMFGMAMRF